MSSHSFICTLCENVVNEKFFISCTFCEDGHCTSCSGDDCKDIISNPLPRWLTTLLSNHAQWKVEMCLEELIDEGHKDEYFIKYILKKLQKV